MFELYFNIKNEMFKCTGLWVYPDSSIDENLEILDM